MEQPNQIPVIKSDEILTETAYYKWLEKEHFKGEKTDRFIDTVKKYTNYIEHPFKDREDEPYHKYVFQCFWKDLEEVTN